MGSGEQEFRSSSTDFQLLQQMADRADGRTSLPQIFINDRGIGGCDDLHALEASGQRENTIIIFSSDQGIAIGSHGQTIRHRPDADRPFSLQLGDGQHIAELTGIAQATVLTRLHRARNRLKLPSASWGRRAGGCGRKPNATASVTAGGGSMSIGGRNAPRIPRRSPR